MARYVVNPPVPNQIIVNLPGPQGPKGDDGTSINIKGNFTTASQLPTTPVNSTDAYLVGSDLYVWTGTAWYNAGPFRGPKGDKGDAGAQGVQGERGLVGPVGPAGAVGATGPIGLTGAKGDKGDKGDTGAAGNSGAYYQPSAGTPYVQGAGQIYIGVDFPADFPDGSLFFREV